MNCGETDIFPGRASPRPSLLLIGYGNEIRSDDGVGPRVVSQIASTLRESRGCECIVTHQLVPELIEHAAFADRVLFIDASIAHRPGKVRVREVRPGAGTPACGHHLSPEALLEMTRALCGHTPRAWAVEVGVASLAVGEELTPCVFVAGSRLARHLLHRIALWTAANNPASAERWRPRIPRGA